MSSFPSIKSLGFLYSLFDGYKGFLWSRYRTLNQQQIVFSINFYDLKVSDGSLYRSHMAGHSLALQYAARSGCGAVGTLMSVELGTVLHRSSVLAESLDRALISLTFGNGSRVDLVTDLENVSLDLVCYLVVCSILESELSEISLRSNASL